MNELLQNISENARNSFVYSSFIETEISTFGWQRGQSGLETLKNQNKSGRSLSGRSAKNSRGQV